MGATMQHTLLPALLLLTGLAPSQALAWGWGWGAGRGDRDDWDDWDGTGPPPWAGNGTHDGNGRGYGYGRWGPGGRGNRNNNNGNAASAEGLSASSIVTIDNVVIAHAVMASLALVLFMPLGAMLLRIPRRKDSRLAIRLHVFCQLASYVLYIVAAGMGIWLAQQISFGPFSAWNDPHTGIGVAILILAAFQPFLGNAHHRTFKRRQEEAAAAAARQAAAAASVSRSMSTSTTSSSSRDIKSPQPVTTAAAASTTEKPKGTSSGFVHLWLGRSLLILSIVNGGLGIRLASSTGFQDPSHTQAATIAYSVGAGVMFILYVLCMVVMGRRRGREEAEEEEATAAAAAATAAARGGRGHDDDAPLPRYEDNDRSPSYTESEAEVQKPVQARLA